MAELGCNRPTRRGESMLRAEFLDRSGGNYCLQQNGFPQCFLTDNTVV